ncbi:MAG: flagellar hook-basal body complex protein FliE [Phycisphaerae bacterium]|nr:flagellar hook-basal body complex protein FliE [Phycisphaerae bacterium]NUQ44965.1 flagellar hook-basal body complex protein FliE [Phycisphaerae bacterium]
MADGMNVSGDMLSRLAPARSPAGPAAAGRTTDGRDFQSYLVERLNEVSELQKQADAGVQRVLSGESDNLAEVMSAMRKADVAFSLLMEIRNKLMDAYTEIRQMRV